MKHLISNKRRGQHAACDDTIKRPLVETVGEVTCPACRELIVTMYAPTYGEASIRASFEKWDAHRAKVDLSLEHVSKSLAFAQLQARFLREGAFTIAEGDTDAQRLGLPAGTRITYVDDSSIVSDAKLDAGRTRVVYTPTESRPTEGWCYGFVDGPFWRRCSFDAGDQTCPPAHGKKVRA